MQEIYGKEIEMQRFLPASHTLLYSLLIRYIQGINSMYKNVAHSVCPISSEAPPRLRNSVFAYVSETAGLAEESVNDDQYLIIRHTPRVSPQDGDPPGLRTHISLLPSPAQG